MTPLLLALLLSSAAPEEYPPEPPSPCAISWSIEHGTQFVELTQPRIERRCTELVASLDYDAAAGSILVEIGGEMAAFTVAVRLLEGGEVVEEVLSKGDVCECGGNDLALFAMKRVASAIEQRKRSLEEASNPVPPEVSPHTAPSHEPSRNEPKAIGPLGIAGAVIGGLGIGGVVVGAVLLPRADEERFDSTTNTGITETTYRTPAIGSLAIGGAMLVAGTAMLVTDLVQRKKKRQAAATVIPSMGARGLALTLTGRF